MNTHKVHTFSLTQSLMIQITSSSRQPFAWNLQYFTARTQYFLSANIFLFEEGLFVIGHFLHEEKCQF